MLRWARRRAIRITLANRMSERVHNFSCWHSCLRVCLPP